MSVNVFLIAENVDVSIGLLSLINQCLSQFHFFLSLCVENLCCSWKVPTQICMSSFTVSIKMR